MCMLTLNVLINGVLVLKLSETCVTVGFHG